MMTQTTNIMLSDHDIWHDRRSTRGTTTVFVCRYNIIKENRILNDKYMLLHQVSRSCDFPDDRCVSSTVIDYIIIGVSSLMMITTDTAHYIRVFEL